MLIPIFFFWLLGVIWSTTILAVQEWSGQAPPIPVHILLARCFLWPFFFVKWCIVSFLRIIKGTCTMVKTQ